MKKNQIPDSEIIQKEMEILRARFSKSDRNWYLKRVVNRRVHDRIQAMCKLEDLL